MNDNEFEQWKQQVIKSFLPKVVSLTFADSQAAKFALKHGAETVTSPDGIKFVVIAKQHDDYDKYNEGDKSSKSNIRPGQYQRLSEDTGLVGID